MANMSYTVINIHKLARYAGDNEDFVLVLMQAVPFSREFGK